MRLVYLGTPEMAVPPLRALHEAGHDIVAVVSGADKRRGRRGQPTPSPVKAAASELGLPVSDDPEDVLTSGAELGVVVAYGRIIRPHVLAAVPMVNLHFSLLPRWRGAAPVERALLAGDRTTGVCLMAVEEGLDTGCVYERVEVPIGDADAAQLRSALVDVGTEVLLRRLSGQGRPVDLGACEPQPSEGVTYAEKLVAEDLRLDPALAAEQLGRVVRVGGAWTTWKGDRLKVLSARPLDEADLDPEDLAAEPGTVLLVERSPALRCGRGALLLEQVQPAGRGPMPARDWANGARPAGGRLGDTPGTGASDG